MSLPSTVTFYLGEKEVKTEFTNCGWFCNDKSIKRGIKTTLFLFNLKENFEWDSAIAYGQKFSKKEIEKS